MLSLDGAGFELLESSENRSCLCELWEGWIEGPVSLSEINALSSRDSLGPQASFCEKALCSMKGSQVEPSWRTY